MTRLSEIPTRVTAFLEAAEHLGLYPQGDTPRDKMAALIEGGHGREVSAEARRMFPGIFEPAMSHNQNER